MNEAWKEAVHGADVDQIRRLIQEGADINARDQYGQTAVMLAARNGHSKLVRFLVDENVELNNSAKYHLTALMLAVVNGHADIVHMLVSEGADLKIRGTGAPGFHGKTAMEMAMDQNRPELIDALNQADHEQTT